MRLFRTTHCRNSLLTVSLVAIGAVALAGPTTAMAAPTITEFSEGMTDGVYPTAITNGPDGNLWFSETSGGNVGRITPAGTITEFEVGSASSAPFGITTGPDGNVWFAENRTPGRIGRITPAGDVTEFTAGITAGEYPFGITGGPDGNVWFTETLNGAIGRITPSGVITEFTAGLSPGAYPYDMTTAPDGNVWFTEANGGAVGRITPSGEITEFPVNPYSAPRDITVGPDGNLWFADASDGIGRITLSGDFTEFTAGITPGSGPVGIAAGSDGNLWFTEEDASRVGSITPAGVITEYSSGITADSRPSGIAAGPDGNLWFTERIGNAIGRITLDPAASPTPLPVPAPGSPADTTRPRLTRLNISRRVSDRSVISYRLSEAAITTFTVQTREPGRRAGRHCALPAPANRGGERCTRWHTLKAVPGSFKHSGRSGANSLAFSGRISGRTLTHGRYRLVAKTVDKAGNGGAVVVRSFTVRR